MIDPSCKQSTVIQAHTRAVWVNQLQLIQHGGCYLKMQQMQTLGSTHRVRCFVWCVRGLVQKCVMGWHRESQHQACSCKDLNKRCLNYWHSGAFWTGWLCTLNNCFVMRFVCSVGDCGMGQKNKHSNFIKPPAHLSEFRSDNVAW